MSATRTPRRAVETEAVALLHAVALFRSHAQLRNGSTPNRAWQHVADAVAAQLGAAWGARFNREAFGARQAKTQYELLIERFRRAVASNETSDPLMASRGLRELLVRAVAVEDQMRGGPQTIEIDTIGQDVAGERARDDEHQEEKTNGATPPSRSSREERAVRRNAALLEIGTNTTTPPRRHSTPVVTTRPSLRRTTAPVSLVSLPLVAAPAIVISRDSSTRKRQWDTRLAASRRVVRRTLVAQVPTSSSPPPATPVPEYLAYTEMPAPNVSQPVQAADEQSHEAVLEVHQTAQPRAGQVEDEAISTDLQVELPADEDNESGFEPPPSPDAGEMTEELETTSAENLSVLTIHAADVSSASPCRLLSPSVTEDAPSCSTHREQETSTMLSGDRNDPAVPLPSPSEDAVSSVAQLKQATPVIQPQGENDPMCTQVEMKDLNNRLDLMQRSQAALEQRLGDLLASVDTGHQEQDRLRAQLTEIRESHEKLEHENADLRRTITELTAQQKASRVQSEHLAQLKDLLDAEVAQYRRTDDELSTQRATLDRLDQTTTHQSDKITRLETAVQLCNDRTQELATRLDTNEINLTALEPELAAHFDKMNSWIGVEEAKREALQEALESEVTVIKHAMSNYSRTDDESKAEEKSDHENADGMRRLEQRIHEVETATAEIDTTLVAIRTNLVEHADRQTERDESHRQFKASVHEDRRTYTRQFWGCSQRSRRFSRKLRE